MSYTMIPQGLRSNVEGRQEDGAGNLDHRTRKKKKNKRPPSSIASAGQSLTRGDSHLFLPASSQSKQNSKYALCAAPTGLQPHCRVVLISLSGL